MSALPGLLMLSPGGLRIDWMDEIRFALSGPRSALLPASVSVAENDRFLRWERNDAGDMEDCLSETAAIDDIGGKRFSSLP